MLFEDTFEVTAVNPDGKKFDKVSRIVGRSDNYDMSLVLDYNSVIYRLPVAQKFQLLLASTLNLDGTPDSNAFNQDSNIPTLMDQYEYVMHGKVFKVTQPTHKDNKMELFVSYGGLLMSLSGDARNLAKIELDQRIYLLIRKVS